MKNCLAFLNKHKMKLPMVLILAISLCVMIYFGHQKEGYHVDELYSYGLANSEYLPFMHFGVSGYDVKDWMNEYGAGESFVDLFSNLAKDFRILKENNFDFYSSEIYQAYRIAQANSADTYTTTWVPGQDYVDYLAVSESNTFNYASVYYNQRGDVHPPFFYMLLHTICSFFVGEFSKWFGLALNMLVLSLALIVLYKMCSEHLCPKGPAIIIVIGYALSCGFMTTAMFIRMYALLTLMTLLCCYVHLKIYEADFRFTRKLGFALFFSVLGGYYTQYYFVLYAMVIAGIMLLTMLIHKKYKAAVKYVLILGASAVTGILIWPFSVKHVFSGYRGRESLSILTGGNLSLYKAKIMFGNMVSQMFGGYTVLLVIACAVAVIICFGLGKFLWKKQLPYAKTALLVLPVLTYTCLVGQISPFLSERYIMCTYPFWCIIFVCAIYYSVDFMCKNPVLQSEKWKKRVCKLEAVILFVIIGFWIGTANYVVCEPGYIFTGGQEAYAVPEGTDCVFVIPTGSYNESAEDTNILAQCDRVGVVYASNIEVLAEDYAYESGRYLLVEMIKHMDIEETLFEVKQVLNVSELREINRSQGGNVVRILLGE